jgi:hypothetical protein
MPIYDFRLVKTLSGTYSTFSLPKRRAPAAVT